MHIAIEGMDGVGKSTTAKAAAETLGFVLVEKPLHYLLDGEDSYTNYLHIRDYFNNQPDRFLSAWFYGLGNIYIYEKFKGQDIITDRHLLSNYCWSGTKESEPVFDLLVCRLGAPDYTFILFAKESTVQERIKGRDINDRDINKTPFIPEAYKKMEGFCKKHRMPYTLIDTTNLSPGEVVDIITSKVQGLQK